jgi:two-component system, OmpR family, phosphate regulon sensor histidine kinase PhoR
MSRKKLLWYIFPTYFLIIIISLVPVSIYTIDQVRAFYIDKKISELQERAYLIEGQILEQMAIKQDAALDSICRDLGAKGLMRITIIMPDGSVIGDSDHESKVMDNHATRSEVITALQGNIGSSTRFSDTMQKDLLYVAVPIKINNEIICIIRTSVKLTFIESSLQSLQNNIVFAGLFIAIFAAVISLLVAKRITNPIEDMKSGVEKFARGELDYRLPAPPSKELAKLAESLNAMAAQLDDKIKEIIEQKNEQEAVLESMVEGVLAVDKKKKIINFNQAASEMFNIDQNAIGKDITTCIKNKDLQNLITKTLDHNEPVEEDIVLYSQNKHYLQGNGTVLKNAQGITVGALIVINDVTRLRRLEQVRQDFVANVSHEIRTPLTSIKGFAETLLDGAIAKPKDARNFVEIIASQSDRLNAIIEDLLILARLEQEGDRDQIEFSEVSLKKVLKSASHVCSPSAKHKNIDIKLKCDSGLKIKLNPDLFEQALVNLIDNAIKYSPKDKTVNVTAKQSANETTIVVSDQGSGIGKKHLPRLFERFYRVDKARSRSIGGTGLGLAIVKHIAQVHSGRVSVESTPGTGSRFRIHLPLE